MRVAIGDAAEAHAVAHGIAWPAALPVDLPPIEIEVLNRLNLMSGQHDDVVALVVLAARRTTVDHHAAHALRAIDNLAVGGHLARTDGHSRVRSQSLRDCACFERDA